MTENITVKEVEYLSFRLARETMSFNEPIPEFSTRYPNILESCLAAPFQTFESKSLYPTFVAKAAMLFYLLVKNHPFQNGNKRIAITTLFLYLYKENKWIKVDTQKLYNFTIGVAASLPELKNETVKGIERFFELYLIELKED